jgi:hypothetical protein
MFSIRQNGEVEQPTSGEKARRGFVFSPEWRKGRIAATAWHPQAGLGRIQKGFAYRFASLPHFRKGRTAMTVVTADPSLQAVLASLRDQAEIRDMAGNLLGYFTPRQLEEELLYQRAEEVFNPEEVERQLKEQQTGSTLEQVMSHLHSLEKP